MDERGLSLAHTTIMRPVQRYVLEFEKRCSCFARLVGGSWRVDETYVKIKGRWVYLYRAVDKAGKTVDFLLRAKRDVAAARAFFRCALASQGSLPRKINSTISSVTSCGARTSRTPSRRRRTRIRSSKYLNNLIEQDHRSIKLRLGSMLGFKRFRHAAITSAGVELMHGIRKTYFPRGAVKTAVPVLSVGPPRQYGSFHPSAGLR